MFRFAARSIPTPDSSNFRPTYVPRTASQPPTGTTPATAPGTRVITIQFQIHEAHAPAFRSAVEEISNEIGGRLEGSHAFATETALTEAATALGALRAATCRAIPAGDPFYRSR